MHRVRHALALATLVALPVIAAAAPRAESAKPAKHAATTAVSTHATKGTVASVDASTLVIARSPKHKQAMTFTLEPSTERHGDVEVGAMVEVRYRTEASKKIATVVSVQPQKKHA